ncbi:MAG TPA: xylose isomerase, partial [Planctomycetaceae bacterium]|nr:xylose isomerase [Planctomycetaceae bacterium]
MYKLLDTDLLELTGRQSEVIEIAMTYGFSGINVDMVDL